ncbi:hypothetical protein PVL29_010930 [Vitis rotundifolia]|uniref:Uncharacterized protein n=1 Tax=Vitis rotundifolia TaxID=103349 RepID=A0AA38ZVQ4_VITRO|nr:hypothetical protein PVL29_010930 [Vitis rotundifolia]
MLCFVLAPLLFILCSQLPFGPSRRKVLSAWLFSSLMGQFLKLGCYYFITHGVAELLYPEMVTACLQQHSHSQRTKVGASLVDSEQMPTDLQFERLHLCSLWAGLFQDDSPNGECIAIENPKDILVLSARTHGQRTVLMSAQYTGTHAIAGKHIPRVLTNQLQISFNDPCLLILTDPQTRHQPLHIPLFFNFTHHNPLLSLLCHSFLAYSPYTLPTFT